MINKKRKITFVVLLMTLIITFYGLPALGANKYQGTDDLIDNNMKIIAGVKAKPPLIDISQGNLGLFVFAVGGFTAGAIVGYQWRKIFVEKAGQ